MRLPRGVLLALALACAVAAVTGLQQGRRLSEAGAVDRVAAVYVREAASQGLRGVATDCAARPGGAGVWVVVTCAPRDAEIRVEYHLDRRGRLLRRAGAGA